MHALMQRCRHMTAGALTGRGGALRCARRMPRSRQVCVRAPEVAAPLIRGSGAVHVARLIDIAVGRCRHTGTVAQR